MDPSVYIEGLSHKWALKGKTHAVSAFTEHKHGKTIDTTVTHRTLALQNQRGTLSCDISETPLEYSDILHSDIILLHALFKILLAIC